MGTTVQTIGRYELCAELGRGSMGVVHRAHDPVMGRDVAIKTILMPHGLGERRTEEFRERFLREARAAGRLSHPGIVTIYDFDRQDDRLPFIAMEFVEGPTLHELITNEGALKPSWALDVAVTLADALDTAHALDIVHRDLKPANVLIRASDGAAKITDFGVARVSRSDLTETGTTYGSPAYIAPECLRGQRADARSDLFALGVMLFEMLSGGRPFDGDDFASVCHAICNEPPRPVGEFAGDLTPAFNTFFARALAKDPERRFQSGAEMIAELDELRGQQAVYATGGIVLKPIGDAPEPERLDPDRPDAAQRRRAAMGRTSELTVPPPEPAPAATVAISVADPPADPPPWQRAAGLVSGFVRRRPALTGGLALGIALLLLLALLLRPGPDDGDRAEPDANGASASVASTRVEATVPAPVVESPFELAEPFGLFDETPGADEEPLTEAIDRAEPSNAAAAESSRPAPETRTTPPTRPAAPAPRPVVPEAVEAAEAEPVVDDPLEAVVEEPTAADAAAAANAPVPVPLTIELRSGLKDGSLVVEIDGETVYSAELEAEARGFRRAMRKAIRRDETEFDDTVEVPAGTHRIVVRLRNNAKGTELTETIEATLEPDGPRRLKIAAGRFIGKRLSVELVD